MTVNEIFALACLGYVVVAIGLARVFYSEDDEDLNLSLFCGFIWPVLIVMLIICGTCKGVGRGVKWVVTTPGPAKRKQLAAATAKEKRELALKQAEDDLAAATQAMEEAQQ